MDLLRLSLTNLDPLTENYDLTFYLQYSAKWPSLFTVAEDMDGNIIGYSWDLLRTIFGSSTDSSHSNGEG